MKIQTWSPLGPTEHMELVARHDRRISELLEANNREVERRRKAERDKSELLRALQEIARQDVIEIALDPEWPQRIACAAIAKAEGQTP